MENILQIVTDKVTTYEQKIVNLARAAENSIDVLAIGKEVQEYRDKGIICDLFEGHAPYRPRYIVPDYERLLKEGCEFLRLAPPTDIWEATNTLLIFYKHVPSITTFPVYIGNIDMLLEPFIVDEEEAFRAIKLFLTHIDRTITDSFCHGNIGPLSTTAGKLILRAEKELQNAVPNITLKYDSSITSDAFALEAVKTALATAKPSFANHTMFAREFNNNYGIASCYNGLPIGGGSHTLVRLNLAALAKESKSIEHFIGSVLPSAVDRMNEYMDERIKFLVEESGFFESSFLVKEGFIKKDNFTAMFGMFGLAECVNHLKGAEIPEDRFGHDLGADALGLEILNTLADLVRKHKNQYCSASSGEFLLHAQVGIDTDINISPGCRIPIGEEPELPKHLMNCAKFHKFFPSGTGDIFPFDSTAERNPEFILDIIKGAFNVGLRYFSLYGSDSDVIRITGYLVKKSDMEKLNRGEQVLQDTVALGLGSVKNNKILNRKVRTNG